MTQHRLNLAGRSLWDLRNEMEKLFGDLVPHPEQHGILSTPMDITEDASNYLVKMELPGVDLADIEVSFQDGTLTIRGEKKEESETKDKNFHRVERRYGQFSRSATLPAGIATDQISAEFDKGVLTVTLPKREEVKPRTINIKPKAK